MPLQIVFKPHILRFKEEAGTSRGVLTQRTSWFLKVTDTDKPGVAGYGECGPLPGLSIDDIPDFKDHLATVCTLFNDLDLEVFPFNLSIILDQLVPEYLPSVKFGLEMALLDFMNGGKRILFKNAFTCDEKGILMNGLIWMGSYENMVKQVEDKLAQGYSTLKMKVGAIDFDQELRILASIRERFSKEEITLRVDANGAFLPEDVNYKLSKLAEFDLHSIEQPIKAGQHELLAEICKSSPIPVALDEELIGHCSSEERSKLLEQLKPAYLVLKPSLHGGMMGCREWIHLAAQQNIGWWMTSYLESSVGLNAIAQFTCEYDTFIFHGLGTGQIYTHNVFSPLEVHDGQLIYNIQKKWESPLKTGTSE